MKGVNTELGLKAEWLGKSLLTTAALFSAKQQGLATYAGVNEQGNSWYAPKDVKSRGLELEASGRLSRYTRLTLGYTRLLLTGPDGRDIYEWVPRNILNFRVDSHLSALSALRLGLGGRWQSAVSKAGGAAQPAYLYLLANAFAAYELSPAATLRLNINNLFDKKYITGLAYGAIYGAPRNAAIALDYKL